MAPPTSVPGSPPAPHVPLLTRTHQAGSAGWWTVDEQAREVAETWKTRIDARAPGGVVEVDLGTPDSAPPFPLRTSLGPGRPDVHTLVEAFTEYAGGRSLLVAPDVHIENAGIGLLDARDWKAFRTWYRQATGETPSPDATAHPVWVNDAGALRVLFVVPERKAQHPINLISDLRRILGFRDVDHEQLAPVQETLRQVGAELAAHAGQPVPQKVLAGLMSELLQADTRDPEIVRCYEELAGMANRAREATHDLTVPLQYYGPEVDKARARVDQLEAKLPGATRRERQQLGEQLRTAKAEAGALERMDAPFIERNLANAQRRDRLRAVVADAPPGTGANGHPLWFQALQGELPRELALAHQGVGKLHRDELRRPLDPSVMPQHEAALQTVLERGNSPEALTRFLSGVMDELAERARASTDPLVQEQWAKRQIPPQLLDDLIADRARAQGFSGVETIPAGGGVITMDSFGKILEDRKLVVDPFFAIFQDVGPKGRTTAALAWLFLSEGHPEVVDLYSAMGTQVRASPLGADVLFGDLSEQLGRNDWPMARTNLTPLLEAFVGGD